jgi:cold shock CspA family protein
VVNAKFLCFHLPMLGKVVWFNVKNGYGFIKGHEDHLDYFAHFSKIIAEPGDFRLLTKGDTVEFTGVEADRGDGQSKPQAVSIKIVEEAAHEVRGTNTDYNFGRSFKRPTERQV